MTHIEWGIHYQPNLIHYMKKLFAVFASLALAGSVFAGCPSKAFKAKLVGFDKESKTLTLKAGKKDVKVKVGSKTEMAGFDCPTKLAAGASLEIHGCNCATKKGQVQEATKVAVAGKKKGKKKDS
jgi:hypothetical protein